VPCVGCEKDESTMTLKSASELCKVQFILWWFRQNVA